MTAILYSFRRCPYAMRGRMALHVSGIACKHREVTLGDKPQAMLDVSPKGTVPVFVCSDGSVIDESLDLMRWALLQNDPENWLAYGQTDPLIDECDGDFKYHLDRYKYANRYEDVPRGAVNLDHRAMACDFIEQLESALQGAPFLRGPSRSLADIAIFPFLRQFVAVEREWWAAAPYPKTRAWLAGHLESDLFKAVMVKYKPWSPEGDAKP